MKLIPIALMTAIIFLAPSFSLAQGDGKPNVSIACRVLKA